MFRFWFLPVGSQGAKDNTVVCMDAGETCTSKMIENPSIRETKCSMRCMPELEDEWWFEISIYKSKYPS